MAQNNIDKNLSRLVSDRDAGKLTQNEYRRRRNEIDRQIVALLFPKGVLEDA